MLDLKFASRVTHFQLKVCHYLGGDKGGGGSGQTVTKCDKWEGVENQW